MTMTRGGMYSVQLLTAVLITVLLGFVSLTMAAESGEGLKKSGTDQPADRSGSPDPAVVPSWAAFEGQAKGPVTVFWHPLWGTPKTVYGMLSAPVTPSVTAAQRFLADHSSLFKFDPTLGDLQLSREIDGLIGRQFVFAQVYRGVPVYGGEVKVQFDQNGRVIALNNSYVPLPYGLDHVPQIAAGGAMAAASEHLPPQAQGKFEADDLPAQISNLVIYAEEGIPVLGWEIIHHTWGPTWQSFVHAKTGRLLGPAKDLNRYVTGSGKVFKVNALVDKGTTALRDNNNANSAEFTYSTCTLNGLASTRYLDGEYASSSASKRRVQGTTTYIFNVDRSSNGFSETMGYCYLDYAQRDVIQNLGFVDGTADKPSGTRAINKRQQVFSVDRLTQDNSYYSPSTKNITYGTGGVDDAEDAEVIWHEYGHSIQDNQVPGFGSSAEAGAMGEGFGDYWAGSLSARFRTINWSDGKDQSLCVAEWDATSYSGTNPPCLRRLDSGKKYPADVVGQVHADGQIWSAALWQIRGLLGPEKADRLILQHHFLIAKDASFNNAANALLTTITAFIGGANTYGYTSAERDKVVCILRTRGFTVGGSSTPCPW